jgi:hypothetical protein
MNDLFEEVTQGQKAVTMDQVTDLSRLNDDLRATILRVARRLRRVFVMTGRSLHMRKDGKSKGVEEPVSELFRKQWTDVNDMFEREKLRAVYFLQQAMHRVHSGRTHILSERAEEISRL